MQRHELKHKYLNNFRKKIDIDEQQTVLVTLFKGGTSVAVNKFSSPGQLNHRTKHEWTPS